MGKCFLNEPNPDSQLLLNMYIYLSICLFDLQLKPNYMLFYILLSLIKILAMIILIISDVILSIWAPIISFYMIMLCTYAHRNPMHNLYIPFKIVEFTVLGTYYWLVVYSFYAALGGDLFI